MTSGFSGSVSLFLYLFLGFAPIGNSLIGMLADSIGTTKAITISAIIYIIASALFMYGSYRLQLGKIS